MDFPNQHGQPSREAAPTEQTLSGCQQDDRAVHIHCPDTSLPFGVSVDFSAPPEVPPGAGANVNISIGIPLETVGVPKPQSNVVAANTDSDNPKRTEITPEVPHTPTPSTRPRRRRARYDWSEITPQEPPKDTLSNSCRRRPSVSEWSVDAAQKPTQPESTTPRDRRGPSERSDITPQEPIEAPAAKRARVDPSSTTAPSVDVASANDIGIAPTSNDNNSPVEQPRATNNDNNTPVEQPRATTIPDTSVGDANSAAHQPVEVQPTVEAANREESRESSSTNQDEDIIEPVDAQIENDFEVVPLDGMPSDGRWNRERKEMLMSAVKKTLQDPSLYNYHANLLGIHAKSFINGNFEGETFETLFTKAMKEEQKAARKRIANRRGRKNNKNKRLVSYLGGDGDYRNYDHTAFQGRDGKWVGHRGGRAGAAARSHGNGQRRDLDHPRSRDPRYRPTPRGRARARARGWRPFAGDGRRLGRAGSSRHEVHTFRYNPNQQRRYFHESHHLDDHNDDGADAAGRDNGTPTT